MPLKQSFVLPCFQSAERSLADLCREAKRMGYAAVETWGRDGTFEELVATAKASGLAVASFTGHESLAKGIANRAERARVVAEIGESIAVAARHGIPGVIVLSGNREPGVSDADQRQAAVDALKALAPLAEKHGVNLNLEVLNSLIDHAGYICDRLEWAVDVVKRVNSPRVRILFDIYHRQIMEGDVIRAIRDTAPLIGHMHTAGHPGRHELDDRQELNWRAIAKAIADSGYTGYVAHELFPTGDKLAALRQAYEVCRV
jgi:hydroxypyruvate isomerase